MKAKVRTHRPPRPAGLTRWRPLVFCLLGLGTFAQAQLGLPAVTDTVDRTIDSVERLPRDSLPDVTSALERRLKAPLPDRLPDNLRPPVEPLGALPSALPILDSRGATLFMDVEVEDGWRAVQHEWLLMLAPGELALLTRLDVEILERKRLSSLGLDMVRFRVPARLDSYAALHSALPADLAERLDRNHIYSPQAAKPSSASAERPRKPVCEQAVKVGMVDTAIATEHPGLIDSRILERNFLPDPEGAEETGPPTGHGTAVAGLMLGIIDETPARLPGATLYNASVFYSRNQYAQGATMMHLVSGLEWLTEQQVSVINMSLTGPDNRILATAMERIIGQGTAVVAAAGNEGPAAPPLYPAAYAGVIASTAVDAEGQVYRWANRGEHIDFAGHGVSVRTTRGNGEFGHESGTSMAAPTVTAHVACALANQRASSEEVVRYLAGQAKDLGEAGRDRVFGHGLLE
ncbi:S8 family serine peptidase [Marinimicrobium sp. C2-29]|uniref:S8 family serine peptidase n=1 Tax=Marinimicrobium sp. C2-29 TaxID=3139825 RepID=UPI00313A391E